MSNNNAPTQYDPLPLTNDDYHNNLYNGPPSPDPGLSMFHTPQMDPRELGPDENAIPPGAAQPRFLGAALYSSSPSIRDSFASSNPTIPGAASEYNSSLYALNDPHGTGDNYRDNPSHDNVSSTMGRMLDEKRAAYIPRTKSSRKVMIAAIIVALALIIAAVVIPLYLFVIKPNHSNNTTKATTSSSAPSPSTSASSGGTNVRITGGNGSVITLENGTTFTYENPFGGYWYWDEKDPLNQDARAQSWSPALNETFNYGVDQVRGVNLGGWLVLEPVSQTRDFN
jgi:glucan 1,3-beta-glucosidase